VWVVAGVLVLLGELVAWAGRPGGGVAQVGVAWALSPASNCVTIRLTAGGGLPGRQVLARSHLVVSEGGHLRGRSAGGAPVRVPVPPGRRAQLLVQVTGPQPLQRTLTVTVPPALRVIASRRGSGGLLVRMSGPLRRGPHRRLCGKDEVSFPAVSEVAVATSPDVCRARLRLTARDGEQAVVPVTIPALPEAPLYSFASPAGRAIYITVDDGWTPSSKVLAIMRRTHLPVTAFLIEQAAQRDLPYWRAFVRAGGTVGDHTVSHPDLTKKTLSQATAQWAQARQALGHWFGQAPLMGRPPYGAFNRTVLAAARRSGLTALAGWSATVNRSRIQTWDGKALAPGEIVLLHWVPGLGRQLTRLLATIHARHLHPMPLTPASFTRVTPQRQPLNGD
jgi:peptidoglycan/xylan/chitin deacetylase (PgdA/CDA1 family)